MNIKTNLKDMKKHIKNHLEQINSNHLFEFKKDSFIEMASCTNGLRRVQLGVNGMGLYMVISYIDAKLEKFTFVNTQDAIDKYTELLTID